MPTKSIFLYELVLNAKCIRQKFFTSLSNYVTFDTTRPTPVDHGYVFSMAVGTIGEWLKLVLFLLGDVQLIQLIQLTP